MGICCVIHISNHKCKPGSLLLCSVLNSKHMPSFSLQYVTFIPSELGLIMKNCIQLYSFHVGGTLDLVLASVKRRAVIFAYLLYFLSPLCTTSLTVPKLPLSGVKYSTYFNQKHKFICTGSCSASLSHQMHPRNQNRRVKLSLDTLS